MRVKKKLTKILILITTLILLKPTFQDDYTFEDEAKKPEEEKVIDIKDEPWHTKNPHKFQVLSNYIGLTKYSTSNSKDTKLKYLIMTRELIPSIKSHLEETLKVRELNKHIIRQEECSGAKIPSELRGILSEFDLYIFWTSDDKINKDNFVDADVCGYHPFTKRPLLLRINLNIKYVSLHKSKISEQFVDIMKEVYKAIAFNTKYVQHFVKIDGDKVTTIPYSKVVKEQNKGASNEVIKIVTPKVVSYARKYTNCNNLDGVPVDPKVYDKEGGLEWDFHYLGNEMMSSGSNLNAPISELTFAFLEDTGWYTVNYGMSEFFSFRKGEGCNTLKKSCDTEEKPPCSGNIEQFKYHCYYDDTTVVSCTKKTNQNYCEFMSGGDFQYEDCRKPRNFNIRAGSGEEQSEYFGMGSRCFEGNIKYGSDVRSAFCFKTKCEGNRPVLTIGDREYRCNNPKEKLKIHGDGRSGHIRCPIHPEKFCEKMQFQCPEECNLHGRCLKNKRCHCYANYRGNYCKDIIDPKKTVTPKPQPKPPGRKPTPIEMNMKPILIPKPKQPTTNPKPKPNPPRPKPTALPEIPTNNTQYIWKMDYENIFDKIENATCPENCDDMGECVKGKCKCIQGYSGKACQRFSAEAVFGFNRLFSLTFIYFGFFYLIFIQ